MIPPMDGLTVLLLLREEGIEIPTILIPGLSDEQTVARARDLGVREYLVKSQFTPAELMGLVKQYAPLPSRANRRRDAVSSPHRSAGSRVRVGGGGFR